MPTESLLSNEVKAVLAEDLRHCKYTAEQVAAAISALAGKDVSPTQIEAFASTTTPQKLPLDLIPAWVRITGSRKLLDLFMAHI